MKDKISLLLLLMRFVLYIMDIASDIYVAVQYYKNGEIWWCSITLIFVIVPHFIINTYAAFMNVSILGFNPRLSFLMWIFQISIVASFKQEFNRWKRERKKDEVHMIKLHSDVTLSMHHTFICLVEAFAESAPQWCLQNYIMIRQWYFPWYTAISTFLSLFSLAWSITSLETSHKTAQWTRQWVRSTCNHHGAEFRDGQWVEATSFPKVSLVIFLVAHLFLLISRLTSLVIFAYVFRYHVFVIVGLHWLLALMAINWGRGFLLSNRTPFPNRCNSSEIKKWIRQTISIILNASLRAFPMIFYLSSSISKLIFQEKIRKRFTTVVFVFYAILFLENTVMVSVAIYSEAPRINFLTKIVLPIVFAGFISGALFLMLYYRRYHPSTIKIGNVQSTKTDAHVLRRSKYKEDNIEMEDAEMMNN